MSDLRAAYQEIIDLCAYYDELFVEKLTYFRGLHLSNKQVEDKYFGTFLFDVKDINKPKKRRGRPCKKVETKKSK